MNDLTLKYLHCICNHKTFSACIAVKKKKNDKSDKQFCEKNDRTEMWNALKNKCLKSELMANLHVT